MLDKIIKLLKLRFAGEMTLKDGTPIIISGDLTIGVEVKVNGPDGPILLPAGTYELESGQIITVDEKGLITDIVEVVDTPENPDTETGAPSVDEPIEVEEVKDPVVEEPKEPTDSGTTTKDMPVVDMETKFKDLEDRIKSLEDKTSKLSEETTKFDTDLELIKNKATFSKELSKNSSPDVATTSPLVDKINRIRQLKK